MRSSIRALPSDAAAERGAETAVVRLVDVFKIYREAEIETVALRGANLALHPGEFVAVLGRSGSGKSTLLNLLGGLDLPSAGKVWVAGRDITRLDERARAALRLRQIGYVYQDGNLLPYLTAQENVELPIRLAGGQDSAKRAEELLAALGVRHRQHHRPSALSGGERQRVAVACALANIPALLLADEITGELDSASAEGVLAVLSEVRQQFGTTMLAVTHNAVVAAEADRVVRMVDGRLEDLLENARASGWDTPSKSGGVSPLGEQR
ncbi:MAG: putative superfamily (atp&) transport protein [Chloroflexi bacterium]|nr:putative superfamily (atp&) transport protein [Chloroflexota bacterium]